MVWEECIIMMPKQARFVFLSATIPNAREFADWIAKVHGCGPAVKTGTHLCFAKGDSHIHVVHCINGAGLSLCDPLFTKMQRGFRGRRRLTACAGARGRSPCHVVYTDFRPTPLQHYIFPAGAENLFMVVDDQARFREDNFQAAIAALTDGAAAEAAGKGAPLPYPTPDTPRPQPRLGTC